MKFEKQHHSQQYQKHELLGVSLTKYMSDLYTKDYNTTERN